MKLTKILTLALGLGALASVASAQVALNDFSSFVVPNQTFFSGEWASDADGAPLGTFTQTSSGYALEGATSADTASVSYYFSSTLDPVDLSGYDSLAFTGRLLAGNSASTLSISLIDSGNNYATAVFDLSSYSLSSGATTTALLTASDAFSASSVVGFLITGGDVTGGSIVSVSLQGLSAVSASAVPEPSTYAAICGAVVLLGAVVLRRRRSVA